MKVGELIKELEQYDPETEVCVNNLDIYFTEEVPAGYDGVLERLIIDEKKKPYYSIVGGKVTSQGMKVRLRCYGIEDIILDDLEAPVDLSGLSEYYRKRWQDKIDKYREEFRQMIKEIEESELSEKSELD